LWYPKQLHVGESLPDGKTESMALLTMMHGDGAWKLVAPINVLKFGNFRAQIVPASPDIEASVQNQLVETMKKWYKKFKTTGGKIPDLPPPALEPAKVATAPGGE